MCGKVHTKLIAAFISRLRDVNSDEITSQKPKYTVVPIPANFHNYIFSQFIPL